MACESTWTGGGTRTVRIVKQNDVTRNIVTFEVLDSDARTHVLGQDGRCNVVGVIYKRVTIEHKQYRRYSLIPDTPGAFPTAPPVNIADVVSEGGPYVNDQESNMKDTKMEDRPLTYLDDVSVRDWHDYGGMRTVEYKLCLLVGEVKYNVALGTVVITNHGRYQVDGTDLQLKQGGGALTEEGPTFSVTGDRIYGANVNCGKKALTYTFDVETYGGVFNSLKTDTPLNVEDYNECWTKTKRIVGAYNYYGIHDQREFLYGVGAILPDEVMAVGYQDTRR